MTSADLEEAAQYLKWTAALEEPTVAADAWTAEPEERTIAPAERRAFAERQLSARRRLYLLRSFYDTCRCRMARIHVLTASAVVLGRFCGFSATFDAIGDALMPVTDAGAPRTPAWSRYRAACDARKPLDERDALWTSAHVEDMERVRAEGLDRAFYAEADLHDGNPTYRLLRQHMQLTLDARLVGHSALADAVPHEAGVGQGVSLTLRRIARGIGVLVSAYGAETRRALLRPMVPSRPGLSGDREAAATLLASSATATSAAGSYRRAVRLARRGVQAAEGDSWPLLATVLGNRVNQLAPLVLEFCSNPARFRVTATHELDTLPGRFWYFAQRTLVGQSLYETQLPEMEGRFRSFRRHDGSMNVVRELRSGEVLRILESDFAVREDPDRPRLVEVFPDRGVEVELDVEPAAKGGLVVRSRRVFLRGVRLPDAPVKVEFRARRVVEASGRASVEIDQLLLMQPATWWGRLLARVLRQPGELGRVRYRAFRE
jgi:hypothetical protein